MAFSFNTHFTFLTFILLHLPVNTSTIINEHIDWFADRQCIKSDVVLDKSSHPFDSTEFLNKPPCGFSIDTVLIDAVDTKCPKDWFWGVGARCHTPKRSIALNSSIFSNKFWTPISSEILNLSMPDTEPHCFKRQVRKLFSKGDAVSDADCIQEGVIRSASPVKKSPVDIIKSAVRAIAFTGNTSHTIMEAWSEYSISTGIDENRLSEYVNLAGIDRRRNGIIDDLSAIGSHDDLGAITVDQDDSTAKNSGLSIERIWAHNETDSEYVVVRFHLLPNASMYGEGNEIYYFHVSIDLDISRDYKKWFHLFGRWCSFNCDPVR